MNAFAFAADLLDPPEIESSHREWCEENLGHFFPLDFGPHHEWLFERVGDAPAGVRAFCGAARGSGKTTTALFGVPLAAIALATHRFVVIVRASQHEADAALEIIRTELDRNEELVERNPRLRFAKKANTNKDKKNTFREIQLVGGIIVALGAGAKLRGLLRRDERGRLIRPDLFVFDDLEDAEQARSKERTDRLEEWIFADVSNLGGTKRKGSNANVEKIDIIGIGTTLDTDALAVRALKKKGRFRKWQTKAFPAEHRNKKGKRVANWPEGQPLEVLDILLDKESEEFIGSYTYAKEYLLDPRQREDAVIKSQYLKWGKAPDSLGYLSVGIDPAAGEKQKKGDDYSALVRVGLEPDGAIWVTNVWRGWVGMKKLFDRAEEFVLNDRGEQEATIAFEAVGGFAWGLRELRARGLGHRGVTPHNDKVSRFQVVALMYERGVVFHDDSLKESDFEDELLNFPGGEHDDMVDALYWAIMLATNAGRRAKRGENEGG